MAAVRTFDTCIFLSRMFREQKKTLRTAGSFYFAFVLQFTSIRFGSPAVCVCAPGSISTDSFVGNGSLTEGVIRSGVCLVSFFFFV